jgi:hypothetical protein
MFRSFPKDRPIKDAVFLLHVKEVINHCEWPDLCYARNLQSCHIRARGMGGGRRKDAPLNIVILCGHHHNLYDNVEGQSRERQAQWIAWIRKSRSTEDWRRIRGYVQA